MPPDTMLAKALALIPSRDDAQLAQMAANARHRPSDPASAAVLEAVAREQQARRQSPAIAARPDAARIAEAVRDMDLVGRLTLAFQEMPLTEAQVKRLRLLHDHPGRSEDELAELAGDAKRGAFRLIIGGLCRDRRAYLPEPDYVPQRDGLFWSGLICQVTHVWRLKPEAEEAARRAGYFPQNAAG